MYRRFKLDVSRNIWQDYFYLGQDINNQNLSLFRRDLNEFISKGHTLSANHIMDNWFPKINADIFLSHSHKDKVIVYSFAGFLYKKFGLRSFIDSSVWGYADELLRTLDDRYCLKNNGCYSYEKRNRSTSHVHMMLSSSLAKMMDKCECLIFINTPNSFIPSENIDNTGSTGSPWIYSELVMSELLRVNVPDRLKKVVASMDSYDFSENMKISYQVDISHLYNLNKDILNNWRLDYLSDKKRNPLDILYSITQDRGVIYG
ncbi:hypothetical protein [Bibersteinia trehalosi]|uniref:hypothetical protein n=1 Tax=Bibersteinia trehalosi TaxID=47735 RepID=UPI002D7820E3|nr:hypothetical protein [Bibersteinia trehalosi]